MPLSCPSFHLKRKGVVADSASPQSGRAGASYRVNKRRRLGLWLTGQASIRSRAPRGRWRMGRRCAARRSSTRCGGRPSSRSQCRFLPSFLTRTFSGITAAGGQRAPARAAGSPRTMRIPSWLIARFLLRVHGFDWLQTHALVRRSPRRREDSAASRRSGAANYNAHAVSRKNTPAIVRPVQTTTVRSRAGIGAPRQVRPRM